MAQNGDNIKTMKLYSNVERIYNELIECGYSKEDKLDSSVVNRFDQYHYYGTQAIDEAINILQIRSEHQVLDIGSGLGGPARYLATRTGCHVTAVEMQADLHQTAADLTRRCGLSALVNHVQGNFLEMSADDCKGYDFIVSWLVFLHIKDKQTLFQRCKQHLKPSGKMYIEDFYIQSPLDKAENDILREAIYCEDAPSKQQYTDLLLGAGFCDIQFEDVTSSWGDFVRERHNAYTSSKDRHISVHGSHVYQEQQDFYSAVNTLFSGGHLGGCKIIAVRK